MKPVHSTVVRLNSRHTHNRKLTEPMHCLRVAVPDHLSSRIANFGNARKLPDRGESNLQQGGCSGLHCTVRRSFTQAFNRPPEVVRSAIERDHRLVTHWRLPGERGDPACPREYSHVARCDAAACLRGQVGRCPYPRLGLGIGIPFRTDNNRALVRGPRMQHQRTVGFAQAQTRGVREPAI